MDTEETQIESFENYADIDEMEEPDQYTEEVEVHTHNEESSNIIDETPSTTEAKSTEPRLNNLPLSRIKSIMKLDPDMQLAKSEAVFVVAKATEMFIESLAKEAFVHTAQAKKKTVQKKDVDFAISAVDELMFLHGAMNF